MFVDDTNIIFTEMILPHCVKKTTSELYKNKWLCRNNHCVVIKLIILWLSTNISLSNDASTVNNINITTPRVNQFSHFH